MMQRKREMFKIYKNNSGFTMIELMMVMAIISILSGIAMKSFITTRTRVGDAAAIAETQALGKAIVNAFLDGIDVDLSHLAEGGSEIGAKDTSDNARPPIFTLSNDIRAHIVGNSNSGGPGFGQCEATVWYANGTKSFWLFIDEATAVTSFPTS